MSIRCTECGQLGAEGANYCQRCGALLVRPEGAGGPATAAFRLDEDTGESAAVELQRSTDRGPAARSCRGAAVAAAMGRVASMTAQIANEAASASISET